MERDKQKPDNKVRVPTDEIQLSEPVLLPSTLLHRFEAQVRPNIDLAIDGTSGEIIVTAEENRKRGVSFFSFANEEAALSVHQQWRRNKRFVTPSCGSLSVGFEMIKTATFYFIPKRTEGVRPPKAVIGENYVLVPTKDMKLPEYQREVDRLMNLMCAKVEEEVQTSGAVPFWEHYGSYPSASKLMSYFVRALKEYSGAEGTDPNDALLAALTSLHVCCEQMELEDAMNMAAEQPMLLYVLRSAWEAFEQSHDAVQDDDVYLGTACVLIGDRLLGEVSAENKKDDE